MFYLVSRVLKGGAHVLKVPKEKLEEYIKEHGYIMVDEDPYVHHFPDGNASLARL